MTAATPFPLHPARDALAGELHARPAVPLRGPAAVSRLAMLAVPGEDRAREVAHLAALCRLHGLSAPGPEASHYLGDFGTFRLKWERHTEFTSWTFLRAGADPAVPFADPVIAAVPRDWLAALPGQAVAATHVALVAAGAPAAASPGTAFAAEGLAGAVLRRGAAAAWTDFRVHADGFSRVLVEDRGMSAGQAGRTVQALWEIETYRMLALLALPLARAAAPDLSAASARLGTLAGRLPGLDGGEAERTALAELTELATGIERAAAATGDRFSAARAYHALVRRRLDELREDPIPGLATLREFLDRRLGPAIATVEATEARIGALSLRCARAVELLRTRVALSQEVQQRRVLEAMAETGRAQLHLQETVEGLSVAGISYYVLSLLGYALKPLPLGLAGLRAETVLGLLVPLVAAAVWLRVRRNRRRAVARG